MDNKKIIEEFRASGGAVASFGAMKLLLLHTTGAKSGNQYVNPLAYSTDGDNLVIFASKGGAPTNPDWYYNLVAHPQTTVEVGIDTLEVVAREAKGEERDRLYGMQAEKNAHFKSYQDKTERVIPVFVLEKV